MAQVWSKSFYASKQWQDARELCLNEHNYLCEECNEPALEVHHIIWLTPLNINDPCITLNLENLKALCHECHSKIHNGREKELNDDLYFDDEGNLLPKQAPHSEEDPY